MCLSITQKKHPKHSRGLSSFCFSVEGRRSENVAVVGRGARGGGGGAMAVEILAGTNLGSVMVTATSR
jgi:hypothetical protein